MQNKVRCSRDPAKFRHTILTASHAGGLEPKTDAEKSSTRRSLVAARQSKQVAGTRPVKARSASSAPEKQKAAPRVGDDLLLEAEDAETSYAAKLALAARENRARSGWAAMVKYADNLAAEEVRMPEHRASLR